ncbi:MAG: hypothetical protein HUJ31_00915, partial [Pseudomonadales bacterium]|nr:hypothetical protein [Pseudomonadales bacterium]
GGSGAIYQFCQAFRGGESGSRHNIEFSMLEWYRPGFDLDDLMDEVEALVRRAASIVSRELPPFERARYKDLFKEALGRNPHSLTDKELMELAVSDDRIESQHLNDNADRNDCLDLLFSARIEKTLVDPTMVRDYPESQAALAATTLDDDGTRVADRFELFIGGMEFANGYFELTDPQELSARMQLNNERRRSLGMEMIPPDEKLLAAMAEMPSCAGVALGVDRLLMWLAARDSIDDVLSFSDRRL